MEDSSRVSSSILERVRLFASGKCSSEQSDGVEPIEITSKKVDFLQNVDQSVFEAGVRELMTPQESSMEVDYPDFTVQDELSSVTLIIEGHKLYVHREVLAAWSPVFKAMFTRDFKEKEMSEIELPDKKLDDFVELLYCMYPPIKSVSDSNVHQLLPLAEEYQILEVKKKCEEFLLTKPGSIELLVTAQAYGLQNLLTKCIQHARYRTFAELQKDPFYQKLEQVNLIRILELRVLDLESSMEQNKKAASERELKLYGFLNDLATGYGYFCSECKSRRVNDTCFNCLKMFREKVKTKFEEAKAYRNSHPCY